jgi:hypothetical protein
LHSCCGWSDAHADRGLQAEVYKTTVKYTGDVLTNLAYHSYNVAQQLTSFLEVQLAEVEKLNLILQSTSLRMQAMKEATGAQGLRRAEAIKSYQLSEKLTKLNGECILTRTRRRVDCERWFAQRISCQPMQCR